MLPIIAAIALAWTSTGQPTPQPAAAAGRSTTAPAFDFSRADTEAEKFLKESGLPGAAIIVVYDGRIVHERYFGSYTAATVVPIASASKWLAGATVMALVDEGRIRLDDPVSTYLEGFDGDKASMTVRQLFNHTSGLPGDDTAVQNPLSTTARAADAAARLTLRSKPGAEFRYGGVAMQVGARAAELAAKKSWREVFADEISGPLAMKDTKFGRLGRAENPQVAGGASSTARDYAAFLTMLLSKGVYDGKRVLSEDSVRELVRDTRGSAKLSVATPARMAASSGYGVGCWVERKDKDGATLAASSPGAFGFRPWVDFERNYACVWMIEDKQRIRRRATTGNTSDSIVRAIDSIIDAGVAAQKPADPVR